MTLCESGDKVFTNENKNSVLDNDESRRIFFLFRVRRSNWNRQGNTRQIILIAFELRIDNNTKTTKRKQKINKPTLS